MTWSTILIAIALVVFLVVRRMQGEAVPAPKKLFILPVVVGALGLQSVSHTKPNAVALGVIVVGCAVSLLFGLLRGRLDVVSMVRGVPTMRWTTGSVAVFAVGVLLKLGLDAGGAAAGGTRSALSSSILLSLGLTLLGEAAVVWHRSQSLPSGDAAGDRYRGAVQRPDRPTGWPPVR